jgi:hypothetical protein
MPASSDTSAEGFNVPLRRDPTKRDITQMVDEVIRRPR